MYASIQAYMNGGVPLLDLFVYVVFCEIVCYCNIAVFFCFAFHVFVVSNLGAVL